MRITLVNNLSARGYQLSPPPSDVRIEYATPSGVCAAAQENKCDAALLPAVCLPKLDQYEPLGRYGIACRGPVRSVMLFSHLPLYNILRKGLPIHVTPASQTSARLFALLCMRNFGRLPIYVGADKCAAGELLIGDEAVMASLSGVWPHSTDLSAWWQETTGLPFVFARWVVRRDISGWQRARLAMWVETCCAESESALGQRVLASTWDGPHAWRLQANTYYKNLRLRLGAPELRGLNEFLNALEEPVPWCKSA